MATIVASFDTKTKSMNVTMDGAMVENVWGVHFGKSYDDEEKYNCEIMTMAKDKEKGTMSYTRLMASHEGVKAGQKYLSDSPEFAVYQSDKPISRIISSEPINIYQIGTETNPASEADIEKLKAELVSYYNEKI